MNIFYSPSTAGFYMEGIHETMPEDVISITEEKYVELLNGQGSGKKIVYKSRKVQLEDYPVDPITWQRIRRKRDYLLTESDWTQVTDNGMDPALVAEWKSYRQSLRDITETFSAPDLVVWPVAPGATKEG